ncbi:MopE-related protein [Aegicerativicinus sediminis]|uniref:MopE-related protein n=1 Tax=Aegicerativicinus sediminis TaxID=2893202 RepID=UPI001E505AB3|nr:MopE-related protein [Aegicerativicinus sediminis]
MYRFFTIILIFLTTLSFSQNSFNINNGTDIPNEIQDVGNSNNPKLKKAKRARPFTLNENFFIKGKIQEGDLIQLGLFHDRNYQAVVEKQSLTKNGGTSIILKFKQYQYAYAFLSISNGSYLLTINIPENGESYTTRTSKSSKKGFLIQRNLELDSDLKCGNEAEQQIDKKNPEENSPNLNRLVNPSETCLILPNTANTADIDILVVYTDAAETWANANDGGIENTILSAMDQANLISTNNALGINFNRVHTAKVSYTEVSASADLNALKSSTDGEMDEIHNLRKIHNADLVCLFTDLQGDNIGGIANVPNSRYGLPDRAFANVKVHAALSQYTFAHEICHNMGANHYYLQSTAPGPTNWIDWDNHQRSSGWRDQEPAIGDPPMFPNSFRTIMTYDDGGGDSPIAYLSDPTIMFGEGDTEEPIGDEFDGDNARTLREMKHEVSRYSDAIQYCLAGEQGLVAQDIDYISTVSMGDINHSSEGSFYSDLSALATCMDPGDTQTLTTLIENATSSAYLAVWIDWNDDKIFDSSELEYHSEPGISEHSINITAPLGHSAGKKRMRIRYYKTGTAPISGWIPGNLDPCGFFAVGEVEDYTILLGEGTPCNSNSIPQNLTAENITDSEATIVWDPYSGVDYYELDYRLVGDPSWTTISNIVYPFYTLTGLEVQTDYEVQVRSVCLSVPTDPSAILPFSTNDLVYCEAGATDTQYEKISTVIFNTINNISTSVGGYEDFTSISTDVNQGETYSFSASYSGTSFSSDQVIVWIDFNQDGDFEDAGEEVLVTSLKASPWEGNITIPETALLGDTTMRIRLHDANQGANTTPCGNSTYGQVEDYTVNIIESCTNSTIYYVDADNDTYGDINDSGTLFCSDPGTGWSLSNDDCNDADEAINPGAAEVCDGVDNDCDGQIDEDGDTLYYVDADNDTYGDINDSGTLFCSDPGTGWSLSNDDCNDADEAINPGAAEVCDGVDNDCDGQIDEDGDTLYYVDADNDTYGDINDSGTLFCSDPGTGWSLSNDDCNDADEAINPGAAEVCDGVDNDCDGQIDEDGDTLYYVDADNDTYGDINDSGTLFCSDPGTGWSLSNDDCNDADEAINPGAAEVCDGVDNDCDGQIDEDGDTLYYVDADNDTYGDINDSGTLFCSDPGTGWSLSNDDCNDADEAINPGAAEVCDGVDNDCDGQIDEDGDTLYYVDADNDTYGDINDSGTLFCSDPGTGWSLSNDDCNDADEAINPGAAEVCDGVDNDCDGQIDEDGDTLYYVDADNDTYGDINDSGTLFCSDPGTGWSLSNDDCNDADEAINPGAAEVCDGVDNDCDGQIDEDGDTLYYVDADNDTYGDINDSGTLFCSDPGTGWSLSNDDCNDADEAINPGAAEVCDGVDNDCDGQIDEDGDTLYYVDADNDTYGDINDSGTLFCSDPGTGWSLSNDDCNDADEAINPGAAEVCDGVDNDCDGQIDEDGDTLYYVDADNDTYGDINDSGTLFCSDPGTGWSLSNDDCNDADEAINPGAAEVCDGVDNDCDGQIDEDGDTLYYVDADNDTYGDINDSGTLFCSDPGTGWSLSNDDCNDADEAINPGAAEVCDGVDNDCDGQIDEDGDTLYYVDADNDTYGDINDSGTLFCSDPGTGWSLSNDDCNDADEAINPGAAEVCDGVDNDCDGQIDEDGDTLYYVDADNDTYGDINDSGTLFCSDPGTGWSLSNDDCNDADEAINPGAAEVCDGVDNDCDGQIDEDGDTLYYVDADNDTYGDINDSGTLFCSDPGTGWSLSNDDCNDADEAINPGAAEVCDGVDNDCDGQIDEDGDTLYYVDADNDTYGDINDSGTLFCSDPGTGWSLSNDDCNDADEAINPGAAEVCDGVDNDCDGQIDEDGDTLYYVDADNDTYGDINDSGTLFCSDPGTGWSLSNDDCNDADEAINPGAAEVCDGVDNDCDGQIDEDGDTLYYVDADNDTYGDINDSGTLFCSDPGTGWSLSNDDCNDADEAINPGAAEVCDGVDNDCDGQIDEDGDTLYYVDADNDTYGDINDSGTLFCSDPGTGWSLSNDDCNDADEAINPGAAEVCDGVDNDCDGQIDEDGDTLYYVDADNDTYGDINDSGTLFCSDPGTGWSLSNDDCNDADEAINPGAAEVCDGVDNDCDGQIDEDGDTLYYVDADNDTYGDINDSGTLFCSDPGTGWSLSNDDCNDADEAINPGAAEVCDGVDNDCDGQIDEDGDTLYYVDADNDTYGDINDSGTLFCSDPGTGWSLSNDDCNDADEAINPGAAEVCDGVDNDCDGQIDEDGDTLYYVDADNDTYGDINDSGTLFCSDPGTGWSLSNDDCNDADEAINPGAAEVCDGVDNDCDGQIDEDGDTLYYVDADNDTYGDINDSGTLFCSDPGTGWSLSNDDCNDADEAINPGAAEVCDGVDNDCDGQIDEDGDTLYYVDADNDTYGDINDSGTLFCSDPGTGWSLSNDDCNDADEAINPGAAEVCDGVDNDCDGQIDEDGDTLYYVDADNDTYGDINDSGTLFCSDPGTGWSLSNDDCNDADEAINPGAAEVCDGVDNDCDGQIDEDGDTLYYVDADNDTYGDINDSGTLFCSDPGTGWSLSNDDCNDADEAINPGAAEVCDGVDNDCDGQIDEDGDTLYYVDADNDTYGDINDSGTLFCSDPGTGWSLSNDDCNDADEAINPGAAEVCDGVDNDCDGQIDEDGDSTFYADNDQDGYGDPNDSVVSCSTPEGYVTDNTDCDDTDAAIGAPTTWYADTDGDGYGDPSDSQQTCSQPQGYVDNPDDLEPNSPCPGDVDANGVSNDADADGIPNCQDNCDGTIDSDGDGTNDCDDLCPNDADKVAPGDCGCGVADTDSDGDGTPDCDDACPTDPLKTAPGDCGCNVTEADTDQDGILDCNDQEVDSPCPGDVDANGVSNDDDNDGIPNCQDSCDGTIDSDGDGTNDCDDLCPNDADKVAPGDCGCGVADTDSDGDGTPDCDDACPTDPLKTAPGDCGCNVTEADTDQDGILDCNDQEVDSPCPGDVDANGVSNDDDNDGIVNCFDNCPSVSNSDQTDSDNNGIGDVCENAEVFCDAGFARKPEGSICFDDEFDRWGWTQQIPNSGSTELDLYIGAAFCDVENRTPIGNVLVSNNNGWTTVKVSLEDDTYSLEKVHLYIGCEPYPKKGNKTTVAPGQFPFKTPKLNNIDQVSISGIDTRNLGENYYIILHAEVCETIEEDLFEFNYNVAKNKSKPDCNLNGNMASSNIELYPNPTSSNLTIDLEEFEEENSILKIYDMFGRLLYHKDVIEHEKVLIDVTKNFQPGVHLAIIKGKHRTVIKKFIVYRND